MHRERQRRRIMIYSLVGVLLLMTVAYAAFSQKFDIKGSTKVTSNWDVRITNVTNGTPTGNAENSKDINGNTIVPTWDNLSASMQADLYEAGDSMEYTVTISNFGTLDAELDDIVDTPSNNSAVIITYSGYAKGQKLYKKGSSNSTLDIKVKIEYNPSYTGGEVTGTSSISFNFKQAESKEVDDDTVISKDSKTLTYNCHENGGVNINQSSVFDVGKNVDLDVTCQKEGYTFLGWNTDKDATSALSTYTMPNENKTLYAIYQKTINVTYEIEGSGITSISKNSDTCSLYNKTTSCEKTLPTATLDNDANNTYYELDGLYIEDVFVGNGGEPYTYTDSKTVKAKAIAPSSVKSSLYSSSKISIAAALPEPIAVALYSINAPLGSVSKSLHFPSYTPPMIKAEPNGLTPPF